MNKKLGIGIIGAGAISEYHINGYHANQSIEIVAICDISLARAQAKAKQFGIPKAYGSYQELLADENIDAVSVLTSNNTHAAITIAALKAGKHVLCEKPPAINAIETAAMEDAGMRSGKLLMFAFVLRFTENIQFLRKCISNGEIGNVHYAKTGYYQHGTPGGWFINKEVAGGGSLIDLGVHMIDQVLFLLGHPKPITVYGNTCSTFVNGPEGNKYGSWHSADKQTYAENVEDIANAMIKFENGVSLYVETSRTLGIKTGTDGKYLNMFGDNGGVNLGNDLEIITRKFDELIAYKPCFKGDGNPFNDQINHFVDCIINGTPCICPARDGVAVMKIIDAIYESARTNELIHL